MLFRSVKHPWFTGRVFTSAGIGRGYIFGNRTRNRFRGKDTDDRYQTANGQMMAMPRYYKNKLYTDEEREFMWGIKQEDPWTYVHGEKIRKNDEQTIKNLTEYYRRVINKTMIRLNVLYSLHFLVYVSTLYFEYSQIQIHLINITYRDWETDRKSTRLNSSHRSLSRMPSSA